MIAWLLERLARHLPAREIDGLDGTVYLTKYRLWDSEKRDGWRLHIHRFHRSDQDREPHCHPWSVAFALILAGGYREEFRARARSGEHYLRWRQLRPGMVNLIWADTFHRVDLYGDRESWSLFLSGPVVDRPWGFWSPRDGSFTAHRQFFARKLAERAVTAPGGAA